MSTSCSEQTHHHEEDDHQPRQYQQQQQHEFVNSTTCSKTPNSKNESVQTDDLNHDSLNHKNDLNVNSQEKSAKAISNHHSIVNDQNGTLHGTPTTPDEDCCTFVTNIKLKHVIDDADESAVLPVSVNLPKDILRNVISEMVRYEQDEILQKGKLEEKLSWWTNQSLGLPLQT